MKKTRIKRVSRKQKEELLRQASLKADLIAEFGNRCMKCGAKCFFPPIQLCHKIPLSQGGKTTRGNCYLGCQKCHAGDHHLKVIMDSKLMWGDK